MSAVRGMALTIVHLTAAMLLVLVLIGLMAEVGMPIALFLIVPTLAIVVYIPVKLVLVVKRFVS